ncbi:uncharacterized protein LOC126885710 [Diabrotica virgifera virgifera]|uniref:MADF domain-containing protein n=1 Tax=Diabrotica virgifera virgifera TaxID=50390 RepID=A0ABM5KDX7_DIAVI|nr:uncharacterized protein LOC126885710 [Diabrotica virgifera virgifera]
MTNNWTNERIIDFINVIYLHPELWNVESEIYKDRNAKKDAWAVIAEKFMISSDEAYKKFKSLRTYAKNEEKKSGFAGGKPVKWFAFDAMSFILSQDTPNRGGGNESVTNYVTKTSDTYISPDQEDIFLEEEVVDSETTDSLRSSVFTPKPRASKRSNADPILGKAQDILSNFGNETRNYPILDNAQSISSNFVNETRNEYASFGEHIANKLRKYDDFTRSQAEMKIAQVLYDCDMEMYRKRGLSAYTPLESPDDDIKVEPDHHH